MTAVATAAPDAVRPAERTVPTAVLLTGGIIAGPLYVIVSLGQALTREGFMLTRHAWSVLANGDLGWIQITNLLLTGTLLVGFALGLRRVWRSGPGRTWAPRLLAVFGIGMFAAGLLTADPSLGFPVGTPADYREISWHGLGHMVAAMTGFVAVFACSFVVARRFATQNRRGWAVASRVIGAGFLASFVALSASGGQPVTVVGFTVGVVALMSWVAALAASVRRESTRPAE